MRDRIVRAKPHDLSFLPFSSSTFASAWCVEYKWKIALDFKLVRVHEE
jgi:hypothetical protein